MLAAFATVARAEPRAHLLLVGSSTDVTYRALVEEAIRSHGLDRHVTILGERRDVAELLPHCDVGLVGSRSEGLPLAVLEYGVAGLAVVATRVGQLGDVLDHGNAGVLVPSGSAPDIATALLALLASPERRGDLGRRFQARVATAFSAAAAARQLDTIYDTILGRTADAA
jgi:glycosyltransferase involved in cell wall biosynthesis